MTGFRALLALAWIGVAAITLWALTELGLAAAPATFVRDLAHPWRAQFYADLEAHLLLFALWIAWRERTLGRGLAFALATMLLGALFTLPYLLVASIRARGDVRALLLGARREAAG